MLEEEWSWWLYAEKELNYMEKNSEILM